jgi:hypothetical protein
VRELRLASGIHVIDLYLVRLSQLAFDGTTEFTSRPPSSNLQ